LQQSYSTGYTPPIGSTMTTEIVAASGVPACVETVIDHGQRTFTFGVCVVAWRTTLGPAVIPAVPAAGKSRSAKTSSARMRVLTAAMLDPSHIPRRCLNQSPFSTA
jgi:hypothetical protein